MSLWNWFLSLFDDETCKSETMMESPKGVAISITQPVSDETMDLRAYFVDAATAAATERAKMETDMLNSTAFNALVKKVITHIATKAFSGERYILVGKYDLGCTDKEFTTFCTLFLRMARAVGIDMKMSGSFLFVYSSEVQKFSLMVIK